MRVLVVGGSGLLGSATAELAQAHNHDVTVLARNAPRAGGAFLNVDVYGLPADAWPALLTGFDAVVYAMGKDDRDAQPRPAYTAFAADHVGTCGAIAQAARDVGVRRFVCFGSYFTHIASTRPELELARFHPYVRSRCEQRDLLLSLATPTFRTHVLELPYIVGFMGENIPPWTFIYSMLNRPGNTAVYFPRGGTAAVTTKQVAQATLGAIEGDAPSSSWAIGAVNWTWAQFAEQFFEVSGQRKRLLGLPQSVFAAFGVFENLRLMAKKKQSGLWLPRFAELQYSNAFIDPSPAMAALRYEPDDVDAAVRAVIAAWLQREQRAQQGRGF